jgi:hypothetical protein
MVVLHLANNRVAVMAVMRALIVGAVMVGCFARPVYAQKQEDKTPLQLEDDQKKRDADAIDRQYKSTLDRTRKNTTETRADPWSNMRGNDDSKTKR